MSLTRTDPNARDPFAALRGNLRRAACGVRRETRCARRASLKHHGESDDEAVLSFGRTATPQAARRRRGHTGLGGGEMGRGRGRQPFFCRERMTLEKSRAPLPAMECMAYMARAMPPRGVEALTAMAFSWARPRSLSMRSVPKPPA